MEIHNHAKVEHIVDEVFTEIKVNRDVKGYMFLKTAVLLRYENPEYRKNIYGGLFKEIAYQYHVRVSSVERNIRTVLESTWTNAYAEAQYQYYDHIIPKGKTKPTVAKFIEETICIIEDKMNI